MNSEEFIQELTQSVFRMYRNIKRLREARGLTTKQLAAIIHIREDRLIKAENCEDVAYLYDHHIKNVCEYFGVTPDELFERDISK